MTFTTGRLAAALTGALLAGSAPALAQTATGNSSQTVQRPATQPPAAGAMSAPSTAPSTPSTPPASSGTGMSSPSRSGGTGMSHRSHHRSRHHRTTSSSSAG